MKGSAILVAVERQGNFAACVKEITPRCYVDSLFEPSAEACPSGFRPWDCMCDFLDGCVYGGKIILTRRFTTAGVPMSDPDSKADALRKEGTLDAEPERVLDPLFAGSDFFDPRDRVQTRYEMLRRVRMDGWTVQRAAEQYGCSRPTYYKAHSDFEERGLAGLVPRKRGPKGAHKLTDAILDFVQSLLDDEGSLNSAQLVTRIEERFGERVHPRSVERALARREKKR